MQSKAQTIDAYLAEIPAERRAAITALRQLIHEVVPEVHESMSYGMPAFLIGETVCGLASQKQYLAFYCCIDVLEKHRARLGKLNCGKCCIRFRKLADLPLDVMADILRDIAKVPMGN